MHKSVKSYLFCVICGGVTHLLYVYPLARLCTCEKCMDMLHEYLTQNDVFTMCPDHGDFVFSDLFGLEEVSSSFTTHLWTSNLV